jgi:ankyrin repeat protein
MDALVKAVSDANVADVENILRDSQEIINDQDADGMTVLMLACRLDHEDVVRVLLELLYNADLTVRDKTQKTARDYALHSPHITRLLDQREHNDKFLLMRRVVCGGFAMMCRRR